MSWSWNPGPRSLKSLKVIESGTIRYTYDFLLVFYSNFVPKTHRFEIFVFKNAVTLKTELVVRQALRGDANTADMSPFDTAHVIPIDIQ